MIEMRKSKTIKETVSLQIAIEYKVENIRYEQN